MSKDPLKNWQLEEGGEPLDKWKLQDTEQEISHMQLQEGGANPNDWQPVDYRRVQGKSGRNWILPSIVIVALLVALGYVGYVSVSRFGQSGSPLAAFGIGATEEVQEPTPATEEAPVVAVQETPTSEPMPPTEPPTPEPSPTPVPSPTPATISVRIGTVNDSAGVNARREPNTAAEIIRLLNGSERVTVVRSEGEWLQVLLSDSQPAWVAAQFIDQAVGEERTLEEWNAILVAAGLPPVTPEPGSAAPDAETAEQPLALPQNVTVIADPGATTRLEPATAAPTVGEVLLNMVLVANGRNDAGDWLLVTLPSGERGWILSNLVASAGDVAALPVQPANLLLTAATEPTPASELPAAVGAPTGLEIGTLVPAAPYTNTVPVSGPAIAITDTLGVNARTAPTLTGGIIGVVPGGAVLPVVGRTADDQWVQVTLPDSQQAWIFRGAVDVSDNIDDAPIVGPGSSLLDALSAPDATDAVTETAPVAEGDETPTLTIVSLLGSNVRPTPDDAAEPLLTADRGDRFPATGRSADSAWIQVLLDDGTNGWVVATTAQLNVDASTLPVAP